MLQKSAWNQSYLKDRELISIGLNKFTSKRNCKQIKFTQACVLLWLKMFYLIFILSSIYPTFIAVLLFCQIIKIKKKSLKTFICNVTEVYNVKYLFFLRRKNKTMIKTLHLCISYLCINSKIIDRAKIHRRLENKIT